MNSLIHYTTANGDKKTQDVREAFIEVMVSALETKNLYEAWENMCQDIIEGYQTPEVRLTADASLFFRMK